MSVLAIFQNSDDTSQIYVSFRGAPVPSTYLHVNVADLV